MRRVGRQRASATSTRERQVQEVRADHVVLAGGAFETPRLMLTQDLGELLGARRAQPHVPLPDADGRRLPVPPAHHAGPVRDRAPTTTRSSATTRRRLRPGPPGLPWVRGGLTEHGGGNQPVAEAKLYGSGSHHGAAMRDSSLRDRLWVFTLQGEDLAQPTNTIDLDPSVKDAFGLPGRPGHLPSPSPRARASRIT